MSDVRDRLVEALQDHDACSCRSTSDEWPDHIADVLLSLPRIAIVELPDGVPDVPGDLMTLTDNERIEFAWHSIPMKSARTYAAALLAAADAADSVTR